MNKKDKWQTIWQKKGKLEVGKISLKKLIHMNGFDGGTGKITVDNWKMFINFIEKELEIKKKDSIYEVGCGSGAFLYHFYRKGHNVGGMDYSDSLIEIAKKVIKGELSVNEAIKLRDNKKYDFVVANSVFHYFTNLDYALAVIIKMLNKANKGVGIFDIPNKELEKESLLIRSKSLPKGEYEKKYKGLGHFYYDKEWFFDVAKKHNYKIKIFDQNINNYGNNCFRFNVFIIKK